VSNDNPVGRERVEEQCKQLWDIAALGCLTTKQAHVIHNAISTLRSCAQNEPRWVPWKPGACHHIDDCHQYYTAVKDRVTGSFHYMWMSPAHWSSYTVAYWSAPLPPAYAAAIAKESP